MQFREAFLLIFRQALVGGGDGWTLVEGSGEGCYEGCDDVVDYCAYAQAVQGDDVAGDEGVVGVVHQVVLGLLEVLGSFVSNW